MSCQHIHPFTQMSEAANGFLTTIRQKKCIGMADFEPGFYVDISAYVDVKRRMLECHKSQLQRAGDKDFAALSELMRLQYQTRGIQSGVAAAEAFRLHRAFKRARAW